MRGPTLEELDLPKTASVDLDMAREGWALFSADRRKRYALGRFLPGALFGARDERVLLCCGLNPSRAGALQNDLTITKMIGFAGLHHCQGLCMVNLEPTIGTNPDTVTGGVTEEDDAIVRAVIAFVTKDASPLTVAAWGSHELADPRRITTMLGMLPEPVMCFGTTANGQPRHPSRLAYATRLEQWHPVPEHPAKRRVS